MNKRAPALATRLRQVSDAVIAVAVACPNTKWRTVTHAERWPVCVVCRHIARALEVQPQVIGRAANGQELPRGYTWEDIHRSNAEQAREWSEIATKEEVLLLLRRDADSAVLFVSGMSDTQLDHVTKAPLDDTVMSVQQMVEGMIKHAQIHLDSIRATVSAD